MSRERRKSFIHGVVGRPTSANLDKLDTESRKDYIQALEENLKNAPESWKEKLKKTLERARK